MSAHLDRARLLLAQSRPADAERESMLALTQHPEDPQALAFLALSRIEQGKDQEALDAAQEAVAFSPDNPFFHYVHAHVLRNMDRTEDAFRAVQEAIRLDPTDADSFVLLSSIELGRNRWPAALEAAELALALNPEHVGGANLRAMALVRLGRKTEAMESVDYALDRAPEDAFSHANQGWNYLHRNAPRKAQEHFREALRLDPDLDYAREGMLEALKARNPVYRIMLAYFLWLGRQSARFQWAFILGVFFGVRIARSLSASQPDYNWVWWPLLGLFYTFVYLSWTAQPMFNLMLRFDRFGRHVLSPDQLTGANWFGAAFVSALGSALWWMLSDNTVALYAAAAFAILSICIAATFGRTGRDRTILASCTGALALVAVGATFLTLANNAAGHAFTVSFVLGFVAFQLIANALATRSRG
jgi:tetratricopeptide (TPR) repeat protein